MGCRSMRKRTGCWGGPVRRCGLASTTPLAMPGSLQESGVNLVSKRLMRQLGQITKGIIMSNVIVVIGPGLSAKRSRGG